jgi:hypothetical protein
MNGLVEAISVEKYRDIKRKQYPDKVIVDGTVTAGLQQRFNAQISSIGDFYSQYITARYTTLQLIGESICDIGVCNLRLMIIDGTGSRRMGNDFIPMDLIASPGRVKSQTAVNCYSDSGAILRADPAGDLFYPFEFCNLFDAKSSIIIDIKNDADADNTFEIVFHGQRILS